MRGPLGTRVMGSLFGSSYFHGCLLEIRLKGVYLELLECKTIMSQRKETTCVFYFVYFDLFPSFQMDLLKFFNIEDCESLAFIPFIRKSLDSSCSHGRQQQ